MGQRDRSLGVSSRTFDTRDPNGVADVGRRERKIIPPVADGFFIKKNSPSRRDPTSYGHTDLQTREVFFPVGSWQVFTSRTENSTEWSCIGSVLPTARGGSKYRRFFSCSSHNVARARLGIHTLRSASLGRSVRVPMPVRLPLDMEQSERYISRLSNRGLTRTEHRQEKQGTHEHGYDAYALKQDTKHSNPLTPFLQRVSTSLTPPPPSHPPPPSLPKEVLTPGSG